MRRIGQFLCFVGLHKWKKIETEDGVLYAGFRKVWECVRCKQRRQP